MLASIAQLELNLFRIIMLSVLQECTALLALHLFVVRLEPFRL
jgi:hypothetical protein